MTDGHDVGDGSDAAVVFVFGCLRRSVAAGAVRRRATARGGRRACSTSPGPACGGSAAAAGEVFVLDPALLAAEPAAGVARPDVGGPPRHARVRARVDPAATGLLPTALRRELAAAALTLAGLLRERRRARALDDRRRPRVDAGARRGRRTSPGHPARCAGRRVGIALMLEPKTACLAEAAAAVGADGRRLRQRLLDEAAGRRRAARGRPAPCFTDRDAFLDTRIEYLADDGAGMVRRLHDARRDVLGDLRGVAEETTSGVRPLRNMAAEGALAVPCLAVNDARSKLRFDNVYGTGQSVVMAVLDATGVHLAGAGVVVAGYGRVGHGIAAVARALGARVTVTEVDPVEALAALHDGHEVAPLLDAVATADVVITASGIGHTLTGRARRRDA